IGSNPPAINGGFSSCADHTGGGNMMVVNGGPSPSTALWSQTITVTPNTPYIFETWVASLTGASPANLSLFVLINNLNVQYEVGRFFPSGTPRDWQLWCESWQTGNYNSITLSLYDLNPTASGNDFAIDDIRFRRCVNPLAGLSGVLYEACDSLPYGDQPVLADWTVQVLDTLGNVVTEIFTDSQGKYKCTYCLPPGNYYVRVVQQSGWLPSLPALGLQQVNLQSGDELVQDFSFCRIPVPPCACPVPFSPSGNLVANSNFSASGTFGSAYAQNTGNPPLLSGQYWVGNNPQTINSAFQPCTDHTSGTGNMLVAYGTPDAGTATQPIWSNTYTVAPNTYYVFSAWVNPVKSASLVLAEVTANGKTIGNFGGNLANPPTCTWTKLCGTWYSGPNTSVTLNINSVFFNWFLPAIAIDDISFQPCLFSAPPLGDLVGVVHRSCDTIPNVDQPGLSGWTLQMLDTFGNILNEAVTDSSGAYAFADLPYGLYWVRAVAQPGWQPALPPDGQALVTVDSGNTTVQNFGFCPSCSCDSIEVIPYYLQSPSDTALYYLSVVNRDAYCFDYIQLQLDTVGEFIGWDSLQPGWAAELLNPKLLELHWSEPLLPAGASLPVIVKVSGAGEQKITASIINDSGSGQASCSRGFQNPVPTPLNDCCITPSINLIPNGSFSNGNTGFSSSYIYNCNTNLAGRYCITSNPSSVHNDFANCPDYTTGSGQMMVVNGNGPFNYGLNFWAVYPIPVQPYTNYQFIFHYTPLSDKNKPTIGFDIVYNNQHHYLTTGGVIGNKCEWFGRCVSTFYTGSSNIVNIGMSDLTHKIIGNDFAIDDMWLFPCPLPCSSSFLATTLNTCGKYQFTNTSTNPPANVQYCWDFDNNPATCESTAASPIWQFPTCGT
ncbi:MAG TPA: carboxypeptidase-like regulatory domain-containing protein, partial [Saprospiraceae bacterium]|nr:carboxypeptidase-like regulatory domain-containing protein [Saprospiraceae bacterium]